MMNRRKFVKTATSLSLGFAAYNLWGCDNDTAEFGIQLWTVRDEMKQDPKGTLKKIASYHYKQIESFEGDMGIFWGMTHREFKSYMDDLGTKLVSIHCNPLKNLEQKAVQSAEIGVDYLIVPWVGPQKTLDDYKKIADSFNRYGKICKENGLKFAYHNHDYSFTKLDGIYPQDIFMENTDPELVDYQMDMYWVVTAGENIESWLKKYPNRFRLCHVKDRMKNIPSNEKNGSCNLGEGVIDYKSILEKSKRLGMIYFIVEQERFDGSSPLESSKADALYMKRVLI